MMASSILPRSVRQANIPALFGTMLENYDLLVFTHLLHIVSATFFPSDNAFWSQDAPNLLFALAYPLRPVGGAIFGHFGDRFGRSRGMLFSMVLMGLPTMTLALLPSYGRIGLIAVPIVCLCRLMQSFSAGAEFPQAATVVLENSLINKKCFASSLIQVFFFLGSMLGAVLAWFFTQSFMPDWVWRMAFLFGSLIAAFGFYIRRKVSETPEFEKAKREGKIVAFPLLETLKKDWRSHLAYTGISAGFGMLYSNAIVNAPAIIRTKFGFDTPSVLLITISTLGSCLVFLPIFGLLADKVGVRKVMCVGMIASAIMLIFSLRAADAVDFTSFIIFQTLALIAFASHAGPIHTLTKYLYPTERRCSGVSVGSGVGVAVFSGFSPFIMSKLQVAVGSFWGPSIFIVVCHTISCISVCFAPSFAPKTSNSVVPEARAVRA